MQHLLIGKLGHLFVVIAFVSAAVAAYAYFKSETTKNNDWKSIARPAFIIHSLSVFSVVFVLFYIIQNNYFEYHYVWSHSSRYLPIYYKVSALWEGQEGSFLLWVFWHVVLGLILLRSLGSWESTIMFVFAFVQAFLVSMVLGVVIFNIKIGSSPFLLTADVINAPIFDINPEFIPEDGSGLNPLLQNYWMVIHPPTLFLGFAATIIPFAFAIGGLWTKRTSEWVKPAVPWTLFTAAVLGLGIVMGAYWAYETLNFGGYWNWDPVENAILVPWIILIGSIHTMLITKKNGSAVKTSIILVIATFILVLYSTFLTRSGILGDSSVHSFTDLGLSGQLLVYLIVFLAFSLILLIKNWKLIPTTNMEVTSYSRDFWIFIGASVLALSAFQVIIPTSFPVFNAILSNLGIQSNMAPPADQVMFYSRIQIWFGIGIAVLSGTGQYFWWRKMEKKNIFATLALPLVISLAISTLIMAVSGIHEISYLLLITAAIYSIVSNSQALLRLKKNKLKLSGGAVSHIAIALMLIGIIYSSGKSKVVSLNKSGMVYSNDLPDEINKENILLFIDQPIEMAGYTLSYNGRKIQLTDHKGYFNKSQFKESANIHYLIAQEDIYEDSIKLIDINDTVKYNPENTYYEVGYKRPNGQEFRLFPRLQENPSMGNVVSPSIKRSLFQDMYTHVSVVANEEKEWSETEEVEAVIGETFFANDYVAAIERFDKVEQIDGIPLQEGDVAVKAHIIVQGKTKDFIIEPIYLIRDNFAAKISDENEELGIKITVNSIIPEKNAFILGINTAQKDYIILKAIEKPFINLLWIGTILLTFGFSIAALRRRKELKLNPSK